MQAIVNFCEQTGFYQFFQGDNWKCAIMILVACVLLFLGIVKKFEPLLLVPIAVGMLVTNLPGAEMYHEILFAGGHIHWDLFGGNPITAEFIAEMQASGVSEAVLNGVAVGQTVSVGLIDVLYLGIKLGIYPCLIFMGVGAMTDFGPLIANPKSLLLGAAAQLGIFLTYVGCRLSGLFTGLHRHHRRCGRPHRHLRHRHAGSGAAGPHCRVGLLLHGAGSRDPAAYHEGADHRKGTPDRHEASA